MTTLNSNSSSGNRESVAGLSSAGLRARMDQAEPVVLLDVREFPEFAGGRIKGSRLVPLGELERRTGEFSSGGTVVCICRSGKRSAQAADTLAASGLKNVAVLEGGLLAWEQAGFPLEKDAHAPWALERQVRFAAGLLVLTGLGLSLIWPVAVVLSWFVGVGLVFAAMTDWCGMGLLLAKAPWNRRSGSGTKSCGV